MTFTQLPNLALARQVMMVPSDLPLPVTQIQIIRDAVLTLRGGEDSKSADDIVFSFKQELQKIRSELEREAAMEMHAAKEELQFLEKKKGRLEVGKKENSQTGVKCQEKVEDLDEESELFEESHVQKGESMDIKPTDESRAEDFNTVESRAEDFEETSDDGHQKIEYNEENINVESGSECESEPGVVEEDHVESSGGENEPEILTASEEDHIESSGCESDPETITVVEEENEERSKEFADASTLSSNEQVPTNGEIGKGQNEALEQEEATLIDADIEQKDDDDDNVENCKDRNKCQIDSLEEKSQSKTKQKKGRKSSKKKNRYKKKNRQKARKKIEEAVCFDEDDRDTSDMISILGQKSIEKESLVTTIAKGLVPTSVVIIGLLIMNYILEQILKNI